MLMQVEPQVQEEVQPGAAAFHIGLSFLGRRWKMILAYTAATVVFALVVLFSLTPYYTATTQILLNQSDTKSSGADSVLSQIIPNSSIIDSQINLITSTSLLRRVVIKQKLAEDPDFGAPSSPSLMGTILRTVMSLFSSSETDVSTDGNNAAQKAELLATQRLVRAIKATRVKTTYVIEVAVTTKSASKSARLANAVAEAYASDQLEARYETAQRASVWLSDRLSTLSDQLRDSEAAVAAFRKEHNLVTLNSGTINEQQLSELNVKLATARAETAAAAARYDQVVAARQRGANPASLPDVMRSSVISDLRRQEAEVTRKEADLVARYGGRHPMVVNVRAEAADIQGAIKAETQRILDTISHSYDVAKAQQASLEQNIAMLTGQTGVDGAVSVRLRELQRISEANRSLYENFLSRAKLTGEYVTFEAPESRIISMAVPPASSSYPPKLLGILLSVVLGLVIGLVAAIIVELLNTGFTMASQVTETLGVSILARIPVVQELNGPVRSKDEADKGWGRRRFAQRRENSQAIAKFLVENPLSNYSEAVRTLRTGLHMSDVDRPPKLIMVTSAIPGEGKSTTISSLALSCAMSGAKTLLMDCDLRKKSASVQFGLDKHPGLVDFLLGSSPLNECIFSEETSGLHILPGGADTQTPQDLLTSARLQTLLKDLAKEYDYVLIDSPPLGPLADPIILANLVDKLFFVVRWNHTPRQLSREALQGIRDHRKIAGAVLTMVDERAAAKYGSYRYGAGYYGHYADSYYRK